MLIAAAAKQWNVPVSECTAADSTVTHKPSGRKLTYGALAKAAAEQPVPDVAKVPLKTRAQYTLLGKRFTGVDNTKVVTGQPLFGIDVKMPAAMSDEDLVNALAQYLDLEPLEKQALLEQPCLRSRAASLVELLEMKILMARTPGLSNVAH